MHFLFEPLLTVTETKNRFHTSLNASSFSIKVNVSLLCAYFIPCITTMQDSSVVIPLVCCNPFKIYMTRVVIASLLYHKFSIKFPGTYLLNVKRKQFIVDVIKNI